MTDAKKVNATLVDALGSALRSGDHGLKAVPGLVKRVLQEGAWRSFVTQRGELVQYDSIDEFVVTPPLKGLGATPELIEKLISGDPEAVSLWTLARKRGPGRPQETLSNRQDKAPAGTTQAAALRRLHKDAPELHADVLAGRLSAHAAMVKAGFRRKTFSVPVGKPETVAQTLKKNLSPDDLTALVKLLGEP